MIQFTINLKCYAALISQTGTNDPTANVLGDEIGGISFERIQDGLYKINKPGGWDKSKTFYQCGPVGDTGIVSSGSGRVIMFFEGGYFYINSLDVTGTPIDDQMADAPVFIAIKD